MDVARLATAQVAIALRGDRLRGVDDLHVEAGAKGRYVRYSKIVLARILRGGELVGKLTQTKCCQDRDNVGVVRKVKVETLIKRKGLEAVVESDVDLRARVTESVILEAGHDLLLIAEANSALYR